MSEQKFKEAKGSLAFSQSLLDHMRQQQNPQQDPQMAQQSPQTAQQAPQELQSAPQEISPAPQEPQPVSPEKPVEPVDPQQTAVEITHTVETGFEALNKAADVLKEAPKEIPKKKSIAARIKDRLGSSN